MSQSARSSLNVLALAAAFLWVGPAGVRAEDGAKLFRDKVQPMLAEHCYECHADGAKKGDVTLDKFPSSDPLQGGNDLWWRVLKNVRSGLMPPADQERPTAEEMRVLETWIKQQAFGLDPKDPDPGRVTLRRLNRIEYRNTIRDLMGVDFRADEEFPPDDTGYGFDTIGDVLTVSPLLLEKYLQAAQVVVAEAVPLVSRVVNIKRIDGNEFSGSGNPDRMTFYKAAKVKRSTWAEQAGKRKVGIELQVRGAFDFDPGRCRVIFRIDGQERMKEEFGWQDGKIFRSEFTEDWKHGSHELEFELEPLTPVEKKKTSVDLRVVGVRIEGPLEKELWGRPKNFDRFFTRDDPGAGEGRGAYAREILKRFATKAFRRPVDEPTLDRLASIAKLAYEQPGRTFEQGMAQAMIVVLASPRFLFRIEGVTPGNGENTSAMLDEYSLASRLSYFLWSTMPDEELIGLAERGELRKNLQAQVKRLLDDPRSRMFTENFTGQWLQARDVDSIAVDAKAILARDDNEEKDLKKEQEEFRAFLAQRDAESKDQAKTKQEPQKGQSAFGSLRRSGKFRRLFSPPRVDLDGDLRLAMRRETEMFFAAIVRENRSVLDLIDSDYTFANEKLAKHYGIPGVKGTEMRKVSLPKESPRGGLLTQGTVLVVTSNPTRTSPVKRGLFVLDNILGTPAPPPPANVPQLEDADKAIEGREPTLREVLETHRQKPLCNACHARMDPLGLALENFNALGLWREKERGQALDTGGKLLTGETLTGVKELKKVLKEKHKTDFYRCLTEKVLTYALGRGTEYYDVEAVDQIVERLEKEDGKFSALLMGIVESAPFQKRRNVAVASGPVGGPSEPKALTPR
jgi:Protein of unknown function (DUF1588)/Protein of unknown function (DUF1587)/Protein of unknown function (DUF1592)/Protein of unknown function (DUF1585)/Protein of unknown function (DUF1595)/Planctomycete cytochrome C